MGEHNRNDKRIKVKITNTEISNSFIKIKAQNVNSDEFIALLDLKSVFKSVDDITNEDIQLGDNIYIAKLDLDNYARCRVVEMNDYASIATIELIDSCQKIKMNYNKLRILPKSSSLYKIPSISNEFIMAELIVSREYEDYRQKFVKFHELIVNKFLDMEILSENSAGKYVQLYSLEASISHDMIPNHPTLKTILKRIHLTEQMSLMMEQFINESYDGSSSSANNSPKITNIKDYSSLDKFPLGSKHDVRISAYIKGPKIFYVQSTKNLQEYQDFHINLQKAVLHPLRNQPKKNELCLAFLESNNVQRVEIIEINSDICKVRLVDYGSERVVKQNDLYEMPEDFRRQKPFAWKFTLCENEKLNSLLSSIELSFYFQYITNNKRLSLQSQPSNSDSISKCLLFDGAENIFDVLKAYNPRALRYSHQSQLTNSHKVKVVYADSPKLFYINVPDLQKSHSAIFDEFSKFNGCNYRNPTPNSACYVRINDKNCRGRFEKKVTSSICQIKLIDIGIDDDFSCNEIKVMTDRFTRVPPLAYKCCLVEFKNTNCDANILKTFISKCKEYQTFNMKIENVDGELYYVTLENESGRNIADELLPTPQNCKISSEKSVQTNENGNAANLVPTFSSDSLGDWTYEERKEFGEKNLWDDSNNDENFEDFTSSGIVTSVITPNDFTIQCSISLQNIKKLLDELQISALTDCPLVNFNNGTQCTAMNPFTKKWCRAIIIDAEIDDTNTLVTVRDIDDGQIFSVVNVNELKRPSAICIMLPQYGIRCGLPLKIRPNFEDEATRLFIEMCYNKEMRYKLLAVNRLFNFCDILCDGKNISDKLVELDVATKLKVIPNGLVYVVHIKNLKEFYVHLDKETDLVNNFKLFAETYEGIKLKEPIEGVIIMAKSKRFNKWYRARIMSIEGEEIEVKYVDFGDTEKLTKTDLGMINDYIFLKTPPLAHRCSLNLPKSLDPNSPEAIKRFQEIAKDGFQQLFLRMIEPKLNRSTVELYLKEDEKNISNELINICETLMMKESTPGDESKTTDSSVSSESFL